MGIEIEILNMIQQIRTPLGDVCMPFISWLGNAGILWILLMCLLLLIPKSRNYGLALAAALCLDVLVCNILLKNMVCRIRPCDVNQAIQLLIARPSDYSFPSGHTAASFASVSALYFAGDKRLWKIFLPLAVLMAFSRMYLYVHYPTDILGGMVVGIAAGYLGNQIVKYLLKFKQQKKGEDADGSSHTSGVSAR